MDILEGNMHLILKKEQLTYKSKAAKCLRERHDDDCKWDCKRCTHKFK